MIEKVYQIDSKPEIITPPQEKESIYTHVISMKFALLYFVSIIRTAVSFYYSNMIKAIGMTLMPDDRLITMCLVPGFLMNLFVRMSAGFFYKKFGFNVMYYVQILSNFGCSMVLLLLGKHPYVFFSFVIIQRISSGL